MNNTCLVIGGTGATGRLLIGQLLQRGWAVRAIVRAADPLPETLRTDQRLEIIEASLLDLNDAERAEHVRGCAAVASCLGHNLTFRGVFGHPRRLVTEATRQLCEAIRANSADLPVRFVLMNTAGNRNRDLDEPLSLAHRAVVGLIRLLIPPHADNEQAADYLRVSIGQVVGQGEGRIEWVAVRPDSLVDEDAPSEYDPHESPTRSAIFNPGRTSRINVAHFMAELITDEATWQRWRGRMPVIYNRGRRGADG